MYKLVLSLALLSMASAFTAPRVAHKAPRAAALSMAFENEVGAQPPLGFWDPLALLEGQNEARFDRLREVEIKHGRISMLAVLGHVITSSGIRWPGAAGVDGLKFADIPSGLAAFTKLPPGYIFWFVALVGTLELNVMKDVTGLAEFPGDYRNGVTPGAVLWDNFSEEQKLQKRGIELNNGRAAMMGILALMVHECLDGKPYIINTILNLPSPTM